MFKATDAGPTPHNVIACTEKLYSVNGVNLSQDTLVAVVSSDTIVAPVLFIKTYEYATISPLLWPQPGSDQVNVVVFDVTSVVLILVGGPEGTVRKWQIRQHVLESKYVKNNVNIECLWKSNISLLVNPATVSSYREENG